MGADWLRSGQPPPPTTTCAAPSVAAASSAAVPVAGPLAPLPSSPKRSPSAVPIEDSSGGAKPRPAPDARLARALAMPTPLAPRAPATRSLGMGDLRALERVRAVVASGGSSSVPYISQFTPDGVKVSDGASDCAPACLAMLCRAEGKYGDTSNAALIARLRSTCATDASTGTALGGLCDGALAEGWCVEKKAAGGDSAAWVAEQLRLGRRVIANGNYWDLPLGKSFAAGGDRRAMESYKSPDPSGHYVVVTGVDSQGKFHLNDPGRSVEQGHDVVLTAAELTRFVCANPANGTALALAKPLSSLELHRQKAAIRAMGSGR